jgi:predicted membrane protein
MIPQTSKKHLLSIPISIVVTLLLKLMPSWNDLSFNDTILGFEISAGGFFIQLFIIALLWFAVGFTFEAWQQWKLEEKPSTEDTVADIVTTLSGGVLGFIIVELFYTILKWV